MRDIAIIAYSQSAMVRNAGAVNEVELILPVIQQVIEEAGIPLAEIDFTCSGSADYLQGGPFAFVSGVDALGASPPIKESHVEMDAAWALYEAYLKMQTGQADSALIYGFSKSSPGDLPEVLALQLDPYYYQPLWPDSVSLAALQARSLLDQELVTEREMAEVVAQSRNYALDNPNAQLSGAVSADDILAEPMMISPLRKSDCPPISDGASAIVMCTVEKAEALGKPYAIIKGIDHRIETHMLGVRDLTQSPSTTQAAANAGHHDGIQVAELHAPFSHQQLILKQSLGLSDEVTINPSGGALAGNIMMAAGLDRIGHVAQSIINGNYQHGLAHATSGPCLQQNLVTVLEGK